MMRALPLLLFAAGVMTAAPAHAARCPHGQILYRSAGVCVSKAKAVRAGIYRPRHAKRIKKKRPPPRMIVRVTYADHVWNWAYANRQMLIETAPEMRP